MSRFQSNARHPGKLPASLEAAWKGLTARHRKASPMYLIGGDLSDETPLEQFENWCAQNRAANAQILLAGEFTRQFVEPVDRSNGHFQKNHGELLKAVTKQFTRHDPDEDHLESYVAWSDAVHYGGCRLQGIDLTALRKVAKKYKVHLSAMEPWWAWMLRWLSKKNPAWNRATAATLVLVEGKLFTWLHCEDGHLVNIQQRRLAEPRLTDLQERIDELNGAFSSAPDVWLAGYGLTHETFPINPSWQILAPLSSGILPSEYLQS